MPLSKAATCNISLLVYSQYLRLGGMGQGM